MKLDLGQYFFVSSRRFKVEREFISMRTKASLREWKIRNPHRSLGNPKLITYSEVNNSLFQVLERHWRWHIGKNEDLTVKSYLNLIRGSLNPMMRYDLKAGDPLASLISLTYPHFFLMKTLANKFRQRRSFL